MTEEEQPDGPVAIERWIAELHALPELAMTSAQETDMLARQKKAKDFNLEAVRRQMSEGIL